MAIVKEFDLMLMSHTDGNLYARNVDISAGVDSITVATIEVIGDMSGVPALCNGPMRLVAACDDEKRRIPAWLQTWGTAALVVAFYAGLLWFKRWCG